MNIHCETQSKRAATNAQVAGAALRPTTVDSPELGLSTAVTQIARAEDESSSPLGRNLSLPAACRSEGRLAPIAFALGEIGAIVEAVFRHVELAEEAIRCFIERSPARHRDALGSAFRHLRWRGKLNVAEHLIRSHFEELLERVVEDAPLQPATRAEVLMALSDLSGHVVLTAEAFALFETLFSQISPEAPPSRNRIGREPWPGRTKELLHEMQHKLADPSRELKRQGDLYD
jgi:hypothetical protein